MLEDHIAELTKEIKSYTFTQPLTEMQRMRLLVIRDHLPKDGTAEFPPSVFDEKQRQVMDKYFDLAPIPNQPVPRPNSD